MAGLMLKLNNLFLNGSNILSSLFGADGEVVKTIDAAGFTVGALGYAANGLIDLILNILYTTCTFVMGVLELIQFTFSKILGLTIDIKDYVLLDTSNPLIKILVDPGFTRVYRYLLGISVLFVIIFTIFAIIKSEYNYAANDGPFISKGRIFARSLRSFFIMTIFPMFFLLVIVLSNAILAGFNDILKGDNAKSTIAGQIFVASAYQANNYRNYANNDIRIPILIDFNDPISLGQDAGYTTEQLAGIYKSFEERGKSLYNDLADFNFPSFTDTVSYRNNKVVNRAAFKGYEKFICTAEQYYVMADFIDYAVKTNLTYHVKSIADSDIDWGYIDETIFNKEEGSLKITYKDVNYINDGESYTITYAPESLDVSTPISDALDTISALLAIGKYGDNQFNTLKRLEDTINVVEWETDLAYFKFSDSLLNEVATASQITLDKVNTFGTEADKILFYEKYKFKYNNSLDYTLDDLCNGIELPVYKLEKRHYQASTASYVVDSTHYVVPLNNTYYEVVENPELRDAAGNVMVDSYNDYYYTFIADSSYKTNLFSTTVDDTIEGGTYISYKKSMSDGWKDMIVEKSNGTFEVVVPAERFWDEGNGVYDVGETILDDVGVIGTFEPALGEDFVDAGNGVWDEGEEYEDANFNGKWDGQSTYITMYDDKVSSVIKNINWPQKLIQDLNTIYSGININQMIATNKWLAQLSEYVSGDKKPNETTGNIQTGLIHPLGLIMSEFFLGEISEPDIYNDYGSLKYSSKFDEKTIKALLLATMGEENYFQLDEEVSNFCEIFNAYMGTVLDEIAYYENFELASGNEATIQLYTYKAYLASMLLSSSATKWMYDTAQLLIGNVKFLEEVENFDGSYKTYQTLKTEKCSECSGSGYKNCTETDCSPLNPKENCTVCFETGHLDTECSVHKGYETAVYMVPRLYNLYKQVLKEQDVTERDPAYPEFMKALEEYMEGTEDNFDGRFEIVLNSWLSDTQREWNAIKNYVALKDAYEEIADLVSSAPEIDPDADGETEPVIDVISKIIYAPKAIYVGIGSDGKTQYTYENLIADEVNLLKEVYSFENVGGSDEFTMAEIGSSVRELIEEINENSFIDQLEDNEINEDKYSGITSKINNYIDKAKTYLYSKSEFLEEDNSYQFVGKKTELEFKLGLQKLSLIGALSLKMLDPITITKVLSKLDNIKTKADWDAVKNGTFDYDIGQNLNPNEISALRNYIDIQDTIDRLNRYYITYGISSICQQTTSTTMNVTVNNKAYTVGQNFTRAKFIEYVLGGEYLSKMGYQLAFVDEDYKGLVHFDEKTNTVSGFNTLYDFLVALGDMTAVTYQMTNFVNLSANSQDEIYIGSESLWGTRDLNEDGSVDASDSSLAHHILNFILDQEILAPDLVYALFGLDFDVTGMDFATFKTTAYGTARTNISNNVNTELNEQTLNNVLSYLLLTERKPEKKKYVDYTTLTLKDFRLMCFEFLVDYEEQEGESIEQNQDRYLGVLKLACSDWFTNKNPNTGATQSDVQYTAVNCSWTKSRKADIVGLLTSNQSQATVLRLAGLENRPYEELVGAEYTINFDRDGVDEANGDVFIVCTYDEERMLYIPFLMGNHLDYSTKILKESQKKHEAFIGEDKETWSSAYGHGGASTDFYYGPQMYPVVAKGIITSGGRPTAIRQEGDDIVYYRDDIIIHDVSNTGLSKYYMSMDQVTVNYTATSFIANAVSKLFTGKSLAENLITKIPKFAAHTDYNFCYGVDDQVKEKSFEGSCSIDFNFKEEICISMENLYNKRNINVLILVIAVYTMTAALWKALWGAAQRTIDIAMLYLIAPPIISMIALRSDNADKEGNIVEGSDDAYSRWKETLTQKILNVYGYAIGFNMFFIITPILNTVNLFETQAQFNHVVRNMSIFQSLDVNYVNQLGRLILLIAAAYLSTRAVSLFARVLAIDNAFEVGADTFKNVKNTVGEVADHWSGQYAADKAAEAKDTMKTMIPGMAIGSSIYNKAKNRRDSKAGERAEKKMLKDGVDPAVAENLSKTLQKQINQRNKADAQFKKDKAEARKARENARKSRK